MKVDDYFVRVTGTGVWIFGRMLATQEDEQEFFNKRSYLCKTRTFSMVEPMGKITNEYQRALSPISLAEYKAAKAAGWQPSAKLVGRLNREALDKA